MKHNTLYNINDKVWVMHHNKTNEGIIERIKINNYKSQLDNWSVVTKEKYYIQIVGFGGIWFNSENIFSSKQLLLDSL